MFEPPHGPELRSVLATAAARTRTSVVGHALVLGHGVMFEDLALEDPHLDPAGAVGGESSGNAVVDIRTQRVQRNPTFAVPFLAGDFRAAQTTRAVDPDTAGAKAHGGLDRPLHRPAESHATLELLCDRLGDKRRVDFGLAHF